MVDLSSQIMEVLTTREATYPPSGSTLCPAAAACTWTLLQWIAESLPVSSLSHKPHDGLAIYESYIREHPPPYDPHRL